MSVKCPHGAWYPDEETMQLNCGPDNPHDQVQQFKHELQQAQAEITQWERRFKQFADDVSGEMECLPECDSYAHAENCPVAYPEIAFHKLRTEIGRLRNQNKEAAERRDREQAQMQSQIAHHERMIREARERMKNAKVDWTDDPPSQQPDGWWQYTSHNNRAEAIAFVTEIAELKQDCKLLEGLLRDIKERTTNAYDDPDTEIPPDLMNRIKAVFAVFEAKRKGA